MDPDQNLNPHEALAAGGRLQLRQQHSVAEIGGLKDRMQALGTETLPGSQLAKACHYARASGRDWKFF